MGKRGPTPSTGRRKRILVPRRLAVRDDHELVLAQHFNERVETFLMTFDEGTYPISGLEAEVVRQMIDAVELLQEALIGGIEAYYVRTASPCGTAPSEMPVLPSTGGGNDLRRPSS